MQGVFASQNGGLALEESCEGYFTFVFCLGFLFLK